MSIQRRTRGFSLIEVVVALGVLGVVSFYLMEMLARQSKAYQVVDQVTEAQQNLRAIAGLVERDLRSSSVLVPETSALCGLDRINGPDYLFVTDSAAMDFSNVYVDELGIPISGQPDTFIGTGGAVNLNLDALHAGDEDLFYDTDSDGAADSDFRPNGGVIVVDVANPDRGAACGIIDDDPLGGSNLDVDFDLEGTAGGGVTNTMAPWNAGDNASQFRAIPAHWYKVENDQLFRDGRVLASGVEDLQFAAFFDLDDDGTVDAGEAPGTAGEATYAANAWDNRDLSEIRVNFVIKTRAQDPEFALNGEGEFIETENRQIVPGTDGWRRRVYTASVRPRNVGERF